MDQKRLLELEEQCIQNQPPACDAACPLHVAARAMLAAASRRPAHRFRLSKGLDVLLHGSQDLLGQRRQVPHAGAAGVVDGVDDGGVRRSQRNLAAA